MYCKLKLCQYITHVSISLFCIHVLTLMLQFDHFIYVIPPAVFGILFQNREGLVKYKSTISQLNFNNGFSY